MTTDAAPEALYERLAARFLERYGIAKSAGKGFGATALQTDGKIFAMLTRGRLVVKLPSRRVDALVAEGSGERFDANRGPPMKQWLALFARDESALVRPRTRGDDVRRRQGGNRDCAWPRLAGLTPHPI
jgi:hypothetical protein